MAQEEIRDVAVPEETFSNGGQEELKNGDQEALSIKDQNFFYFPQNAADETDGEIECVLGTCNSEGILHSIAVDSSSPTPTLPDRYFTGSYYLIADDEGLKLKPFIDPLPDELGLFIRTPTPGYKEARWHNKKCVYILLCIPNDRKNKPFIQPVKGKEAFEDRIKDKNFHPNLTIYKETGKTPGNDLLALYYNDKDNNFHYYLTPNTSSRTVEIKAVDMKGKTDQVSSEYAVFTNEYYNPGSLA